MESRLLILTTGIRIPTGITVTDIPITLMDIRTRMVTPTWDGADIGAASTAGAIAAVMDIAAAMGVTVDIVARSAASVGALVDSAAAVVVDSVAAVVADAGN